ncbi:hypothetical protein JYU34_017256 [Plutella xylostella]|uniref:Uncharacterized protein n=1 Tax=Plutella xylostella TaxID=51655 RepID=A0ABQ7Q0Y6_PLUXY|nr:hypothetical protein JYU34_017256 [Plutella xylostella]
MKNKRQSADSRPPQCLCKVQVTFKNVDSIQRFLRRFIQGYNVTPKRCGSSTSIKIYYSDVVVRVKRFVKCLLCSWFVFAGTPALVMAPLLDCELLRKLQ